MGYIIFLLSLLVPIAIIVLGLYFYNITQSNYGLILFGIFFLVSLRIPYNAYVELQDERYFKKIHKKPRFTGEFGQRFGKTEYGVGLEERVKYKMYPESRKSM